MNIAIVTTGSAQQEKFWQERLNSLDGPFVQSNSKFIAIHEDWPGGAGNGLGSLYAYQKASLKAKNLYKIDLLDEQKRGASVAIYHAAGQGMRLAPLPLCEGNNKAAVQLPGLTILEAIIKQTSQFHPHLKGRLSVFWGDQIFIPSRSLPLPPSHHVEILTKMEPIPTEEEWKKKGLEQYGWLALNKNKEFKIIDKCDYSFFKTLLEQNKITTEGGLGISLGSFTLSYALTVSLLECFQPELEQKKGKMDSDPFFWMPSVLDQETYIEIMQRKKYSLDEVKRHFNRMQEFKRTFCLAHPELPFFGASDIGIHSFWWDYGTVAHYYGNMMKLTRQGPESDAMRQFFNVKLNKEGACLLNCSIKGGTIKNSLLIDVAADYLDVENCLIIHSKLQKLEAQQCLLYHVQEKQPLSLSAGSVRADVFLNDLHFKLYTEIGRDGKADWTSRLTGNEISYEELYKLNEKD